MDTTDNEFKFVDSDEASQNRYRQVFWAGVLAQAIKDATLPLPSPAGPNGKRERLDLIRTREWFLSPNEDFAEVCSLANVDYIRCRNKVRPLIEEAKKHDHPGEDKPYVAPPAVKSRTKATYEYQGRKLTIYQIAEETGVNVYMLRARLKLGWTVEDAISTPSRKQANHSRMHTINGITKSEAEWMAEAVVSKPTVYNRIKRGWSFEDAITTPAIVNGYQHMPTWAATPPGVGQEQQENAL